MTKKIFCLSGNLKEGKGIIEGTFPNCYSDNDNPKCEWQITVSFVSFLNKTGSQLSDLIFVSTNLIRDNKVNNLGETEIWNPYILHLQLSGSSNCFALGQNSFTLSSFSSSVKFYFFDMKSSLLFMQDIDIKMSIILTKITC